MTGTHTTFDVDGADVVVDHMPGYFDFHSSDPAVATVDRGEIRIVGRGRRRHHGHPGRGRVAGTADA